MPSEISRRLVLGLALIVAVTAIPGSIAVIAAGSGNAFLPHEVLARTPFASFLIPGLLLGVVVGGSAVVCAILTFRRSSFAIDATLVAGGALALWIVVESMIVPASWLQLAFGLLAAAVLLLGMQMAALRREPRHRWLIVVTLAETLGFLAPSMVGIFVARAGWSDGARAVALVMAGFIEGLALGLGQAWALPLRVRRPRFALLTSAGAGLVWALVMVLMWLGPRLSPPHAIGAVPLAVAVGLASIGTAQWLELRHHAKRAAPWIAWTALAWLVALPLSFAPGPFVDEATPLATQLVLWGSGGLVMALVMALITWQGSRRLVARTA
ncbi:MAG: hypothetical protein SFX73_15090 [Kofleriaceae bacterium]|nr:hypothetical protein [Kofleriaceae bacterium]